jgi:hypothetical protein
MKVKYKDNESQGQGTKHENEKGINKVSPNEAVFDQDYCDKVLHFTSLNKTIALAKDDGKDTINSHASNEAPKPRQRLVVHLGLTRDMHVHSIIEERKGKEGQNGQLSTLKNTFTTFCHRKSSS